MRTAIATFVLGSLVLAGGADQAARLLERGEHDKAIEAARRLTAKDASNADAWLVLADAFSAKGDLDDAWGALETAIEKNPKDARLSAKLADMFLKLAEIERAGAGDGTTITNYYLDADQNYADAFEKDPKSADALFGRAFANFMLNRDDTTRRAKKLLADCLALDPKYARAHALQGLMLYNEANALARQEKKADAQAKFLAAQQKYARALELDDSDPIDMVRYAHTFYAQGKRDEAKKAYIAALKRHPDNKTPIVSGLYYLAGRDWRKLAPFMEEAAKEAPKSPQVWFYLGYGLFTNERFDEALDAFSKAVELRPDTATYRYYAGYAHEKLGHAKRALDAYRATLKLEPDHRDATTRFFQIIVAKRGSIEEAEKYFEELIKLSPNTGWLHNDYALILRDWAEATRTHKQKRPPPEVKRRLKRSSEVYEIAARLEPDTPQIQSDTGLLFEYYPCIFDADKAKRYFTRALERSDFAYRDAFDGLNRVCRATGDWEMLEEYAERVVGSLERGNLAIAPVGGAPPKALANETPGLMARAKAALSLARANRKKER